MIRINTHFRKMNILRKSMIFTLLISLLLSSFPAYAVTLADNSSNSALASSKLSNAVVVSEEPQSEESLKNIICSLTAALWLYPIQRRFTI